MAVGYLIIGASRAVLQKTLATGDSPRGREWAGGRASRSPLLSGDNLGEITGDHC